MGLGAGAGVSMSDASVPVGARAYMTNYQLIEIQSFSGDSRDERVRRVQAAAAMIGDMNQYLPRESLLERLRAANLALKWAARGTQ